MHRQVFQNSKFREHLLCRAPFVYIPFLGVHKRCSITFAFDRTPFVYTLLSHCLQIGFRDFDHFLGCTQKVFYHIWRLFSLLKWRMASASPSSRRHGPTPHLPFSVYYSLRRPAKPFLLPITPARPELGVFLLEAAYRRAGSARLASRLAAPRRRGAVRLSTFSVLSRSA